MVCCFGMRLSSGIAYECWDVLEVMLKNDELRRERSLQF